MGTMCSALCPFEVTAELRSTPNCPHFIPAKAIQ